MAYLLGVVLFAVGLLVSVCLHEAGHMVTAKAFGMKVTKYFVGFGPTLWSFRKGETEYGIKAIPAGGFVKVVGQSHIEDDVDPEDEPRAFWRKPLWQRTVVLAAGSATHFMLGFLLFWITLVFVGVPNNHQGGAISRAEVGSVSTCVPVTWAHIRAGTCNVADGDAASPAAAGGVKAGDVITAVDGERIKTWSDFSGKVRARAGKAITLTVDRDGKSRTLQIPPLISAERPSPNATDINNPQLETVGAIGLGMSPTITFGPIDGLRMSGTMIGQTFTGTFTALAKFPQKIPNLISAVSGEERDKETPISAVGASRLGGEVVADNAWPLFFLLLAGINIFIGIFNLFPLLPLDGGHIAIAWFERARTWVYQRMGRADPGLVDPMKLMPLTYVVIIVFGSLTLLTMVADIVNPVELFSR